MIPATGHRLRNLAAAAMLLASAGPAARAMAEAAPASLAAQVAPLLQAVVTIQTLATTPRGTMFFDGSGFIIDPAGIIVTNRHVVVGAFDITATVPGIGRLKAQPLFISDGIDLALLKVEAGRALPTVRLGDSDAVRIGDRVMLLGDPLGVGESLSFGVVSALNRDIGETIYDHFIQTDAALNHGNSGGPMFNAAGEVIGINTGLTSSPGNTGSVGIGYALPINDAKFVIDQVLRDRRVIAGTLGLHAQRLTDDLATAMGLDGARGAIVSAVTQGGPSDGKIRPGDVILRIGTQEATDTRAAARLIATTPPGRTLEVVLLRDGAERTLMLTVGEVEETPAAGLKFLGRPPEQSKKFATPSDPGMGLAAVDEAMRRKFALTDDRQGVVVTSVDPRGAAAERKIVTGDVIVQVDGEPVRTPEDVQRQLRAVSDRHVPFAALLIAGERNTRWVALPLEAER